MEHDNQVNNKITNENTFTKDDYENSLFNYANFCKIFKDDNCLNDYISKYNPSESIIQYIKFSRVYGFIFEFFINSIEDIEKYFDKNGVSEELKLCFEKNYNFTSRLLHLMSHNDKVINNLTNDFVDIFKYYIIKMYFNDVDENKREEKYNYLLKNIGPNILFEFKTDKIEKFISIDINELDKFFKTIYVSNYDVVPQKTVYNNLILSILRFRFDREHKDVVNIFSNINSLLVHMSNEELQDYLNGKITGKLSDNLNQLIEPIINRLVLEENELKDLRQAIIDCKALKEDDLRKYCRKYVKKCREDYIKENKNTILGKLGIPELYDREDAIKKLSNYYQSIISYENFCKYRLDLKSSIKYDEIGNNSFIESIKMTKLEYQHILNLTEEQFNLITFSIRDKVKPDDRVKNEFKLFKRFLIGYSTYKFDNENESDLLDELDTKKDTFIKLVEVDVMKILKEFDIEIFLNTIGKDQQLLNNLSKTFKNFFIGRLPESIGGFICEDNDVSKKLPGGINNIGLFITRYYQLLEDKKRRLELQEIFINDLSEISFTFSEIIMLISNLNTETKEIRRLIGIDEYYDFIANPSPNSVGYDRFERENKLVMLLDFLYTLDKVTIPSCDTIISNSDNTKQINFIVGNRTNSSNICHGERTGACMRIGGVGEGLYLKCLTDKNWFHIRIEEPLTHEYISRVSGFRNGNTVYLNQLRYSAKLDKYTNEDLQEFIRKYAVSLIDDTKSSDYPIENVFINSGYAMESSNETKYTLGYDIQKEYNLDDVLDYRLKDSTDIWTDVKNDAILLATTAKDGYVELKNGPENADIYDAVRDKIYGIDSQNNDIPPYHFVKITIESLMEKINRVNAMKEKLCGKDYRYIEDLISDNEKIVDGYASSDWYVYIDHLYDVHYDYISEIKKDNEFIPYNSASVAQKEMEKYKQILINKYNLDIDKEVHYAI